MFIKSIILLILVNFGLAQNISYWSESNFSDFSDNVLNNLIITKKIISKFLFHIFIINLKMILTLLINLETQLRLIQTFMSDPLLKIMIFTLSDIMIMVKLLEMKLE